MISILCSTQKLKRKGKLSNVNNEARIKMLRESPIPGLLLKMGIPTMIGMLVTGFYNLIDAYFVEVSAQVKWARFLLRSHSDKDDLALSPLWEAARAELANCFNDLFLLWKPELNKFG